MREGRRKRKDEAGMRKREGKSEARMREKGTSEYCTYIKYQRRRRSQLLDMNVRKDVDHVPFTGSNKAQP